MPYKLYINIKTQMSTCVYIYMYTITIHSTHVYFIVYDLSQMTK